MNTRTRNKILLDNTNLIHVLSRSHYARFLSNISPVYDHDDVFQELVLATIHSINRYDPQKGKLTTFARERMRGQILDCLRASHLVKTARTEPNAVIDAYNEDLPCDGLTQEQALLIKEFATTCITAFNMLRSDRTKRIIASHVFRGCTTSSLAGLAGVAVSRVSQITIKARKVMLEHVKKSYPNMKRIAGVHNAHIRESGNGDKFDGAIGTWELIKLVNFLLKGEK